MMNFLKKRHMNKPINIIGMAVLLAILVFGFSGGKRSTVAEIVKICIFVLMAVSLNVAAGSLGEIVLGHAGFMCIGAYTAGIYLEFSNAANVSLISNPVCILHYIVALLLGGLAAGLAGLLVGIPSLRVRGDYLAIVTLGFGEIVKTIFTNVAIPKNEFNEMGVREYNISGEMAGLPKYLSVSNDINSNRVVILVAALTVMICICIIFTFMTSRHGRAILAIREDEIAADAAGIPVTFYKVLAFTISAIFAGIGGAMFSQISGYINATQNFTLDQSVNFLVMVVFGGLGSYTGSALSAVFLTLLTDNLTFLNQLRMVIYSVILIIIMIFAPQGVFGIKEFSLRTLIVDFKKTMRAIGQWFVNFGLGIWEIVKKIGLFFRNFKQNIAKMSGHYTGVPHEETEEIPIVRNEIPINEMEVTSNE